MGTPAGAAAVAAAPAGVEGTAFEPPFPIPESWAWTRLGTLLKAPPKNGYSPKPVANKTKTKRLTLTATTSGYFKPEEFKYVADEIPFDSYLWLKPGDLLVQRSNSIEHIGTSCIFTGKPHEYIYPDLMMKLVLAESLDVEYFDLALKSEDSLHYFQRNATGSAGSMPKINKEILENTPIPLPPISEQHAIVARFKKLSSLCERIDTAAEEMNAISRHAKSRILDLAIRGLIVSQNPSDESASALLERIRSTADKPPCPKSPANPPFPIPENWAWTTLGTVCDYGKCETVDASTVKDSTWSLDLEDIEKGTGRLLVRVRAGERSAAGARHSFRAGELLYSKLRTYLNKVLVADEDGICSSEILPLDFRGQVLPEYARCVLMSPMFLDYAARCGYGVKMPRLGTADGRNGPFPLHPLAEQRRIVAKVDELFAIIDGMLG